MKKLARPLELRAGVLLLALALAGCGSGNSENTREAAEKHLKAGELNAAVISLKGLLADKPNSPEGRFLMGRTMFELSDWKSAELELRKALELKHPAAEVEPLLARTVLASGDAARVVKEFGGKSLADPAANADLQTSVGSAYARLGQAAEASKAIDLALAAKPDFALARLAKARQIAIAGDSAKALALVAEVTTAEPKLPEAWNTKGDIEQYGLRDMDKALASYAQATTVKPDFIQAINASIGILMQRRDVAGVQKQFEALNKVAPNHLQTKFVEAQLAFIAPDYPKAKALIQQLLKFAPDNLPVLTLDGAVSLSMNDLLLAQSSLARVVSLDPKHSLARKLLAQVHLKLGQSGATLNDLAPLLESGVGDVTVYSLAAEANLQAGKADKADEYYRQATRIDPNDVYVRTSLALTRLAKGDSEAAFNELSNLAKTDKTSTADYALISARMRRGEWDAALKAIEALIAKQPDKAMPLDLLGQVQLARNDKAAARQAFTKATQVEPKYFSAVANLALLDVAEKNDAGAKQRLEAYLKDNPRTSVAKMMLVELAIAQKVPKNDVAKQLNELIAADPSFAPARLKLIALYQTNHAAKAAVNAAQEAVASNPNNPEYLAALGLAQQATGEMQQALSTYSKMANLQPTRVEPLLHIADVQVVQDNINGALATLRRALDLAPTNAEVNRRLMALALAGKQPEKALGYAKSLQRAQPNDPVGFLLEAEIEGSRKNWAGAEAALKSGMAAQPKAGSQLAARMHALYLAANRPADAEAWIATWMKSHPEDLGFLTRVGDYQLARSDYPAAEKIFLDLLKKAPQNAGALNNVSWLLMKQKKPGALAYAERAVAVVPDSAAILDTLAMAQSEAGQHDKAMATAQKAVDRSPDSVSIRVTQIEVLKAANKLDQARAELDKAVAKGAPFSTNEDIKKLQATLKAK